MIPKQFSSLALFKEYFSVFKKKKKKILIDL